MYKFTFIIFFVNLFQDWFYVLLLRFIESVYLDRMLIFYEQGYPPRPLASKVPSGP